MGVLLVEDDPQLGEGMRRALERVGYAVTWTRDGEGALAAARTQDYSCVLLDLRIPRLSGVDVLKQLRARGDRTPVIVVTANERTNQKIQSLDAGADDYLVKPFDLEELLARVRAQIRRHDGRTSDVLAAGDVRLDLAGRTATQRDVPVALTAKEFRVLAHLMRRAGGFRSKEELESQLYDGDADVESNTIEVTIYALRRKLGAGFIVTGRGLGYMVLR
jgi:two-component system, OmpR family, response regulator